MPPLGGAVERGGQDLERALWNRTAYSPGMDSRGAVTGPSGAPAPQHKQARDRELPASAGGGRAGGGRAAR